MNRESGTEAAHKHKLCIVKVLNIFLARSNVSQVLNEASASCLPVCNKTKDIAMKRRKAVAILARATHRAHSITVSS